MIILTFLFIAILGKKNPPRYYFFTETGVQNGRVVMSVTKTNQPIVWKTNKNGTLG